MHGLIIADAISTPYSRASSLQNLGAKFSFGMTAIADQDIRCSEEVSGRNIWALDCRTAFSQFPKDEEGDVYYDHRSQQYVYPAFNGSSHEPRHRLPMAQRSGSCIAEVRLARGIIQDFSSWRIIRLRSQNLIKRCIEEEDKKIGGIVNTGKFKAIDIAIGSSNSPTHVDVE